ncbi:lysophospholipase L1-like esterase [Paraburkholderia atlantica]|uniref:SGNH/GDSL hydrolase family protein n=1 Tax=Paraburkholderia atlantica TaxID=2654982 RepID=UPI00161CAD33|nr:SGNH/GDSL hydrolase family protein [Paraburkholderia atlantica]MBB5417202.1 lysophospholipase L1-like esterase [Paraburkholderia atlantica]
MKILLIGGSNLVMTSGISLQLPRFLKMAGLAADPVVTNLSVGGTGSLFGLERLVRHDGADYDLVVIEYGINDLFAFQKDVCLWRAGFRGLLELACRKFPSAMIVSLILGRRSESTWYDQSEMHDEMTAISAEYGATVVNADGHFKRSGLGFGEGFASLYRDLTHYATPLVDGYIAQYCALHIANIINKPRSRNGSGPSADTGRIRMHVTPFPGAQRDFKGSRFQWRAGRLDLGKKIAIDVKGVPIGMSFVSVPESCALHLDIAGKKCIVNTSTAWTQNGMFPFLVTHAPLLRIWNKSEPLPDFTRVEITAIDTASVLWKQSLVQEHGYPEGSPEPVDKQMGERASTAYIDAITSWTYEKDSVSDNDACDQGKCSRIAQAL